MPAQLILMNPSHPRRKLSPDALRAARLAALARARAIREGFTPEEKAILKAKARERRAGKAWRTKLAKQAEKSGSQSSVEATRARREEALRARIRKIEEKLNEKLAARKNPSTPTRKVKEKKMAKRRRKNPGMSVAQRLETAMKKLQAQQEKIAKLQARVSAPPKARSGGSRRHGPALPEAIRKERQAAALAAARAARAAMTPEQLRASGAKRKATRAARNWKKAVLLAFEGPLTPKQQAQRAKLLAGLETRQARKAETRARRSQTSKAKRQAAMRARGKMQWAASIAAQRYKGAGRGAVARAFLAAKGVMRSKKVVSDPKAQRLARAFGLTSLPNPGIKGVIQDLKAAAPLMALTAGGIALTAWVSKKIIEKIGDKIQSETVRALLPSGVALVVGIAGSVAMKRSKALAKWSAAPLMGGVAVATVAWLANKKDEAGVSLSEKVGLKGLGEYHMGYLGEYHMGEYHMGALDTVEDRRLLAAPGEAPVRHDTRRDGVDVSIESFSGSLAGDIFDA